jgi:heptosyltransferase-2
MNLVLLAPNWLGDAVLALPAVDDVRRRSEGVHLAVAARRSVAELFRLVPAVDEVIPLQSDARWWRRAAFRADAAALARFDRAVLLPNSFQAAWMVKSAGVRDRWGYASDARTRLLTRAVPRAKGGHQAEYYQRLTSALGFPPGPLVPRVEVPGASRDEARALIAEHGHAAGTPLVVFAPGAAYGKAKQWIPAHVATLMARLSRERAASCVMVGSAGDAPTATAIARSVGTLTGGRVIDLVGRTSLSVLAGVLSLADACVCNDSGAMHLAAAVGTPVVATFGPTDEDATRPLPPPDARASVLTHPVWCRPCMLRECPIDHRCMAGLAPDRVFAEVAGVLPGTRNRELGTG